MNHSEKNSFLGFLALFTALLLLVGENVFSQDRGSCKEIKNKDVLKHYNQALDILTIRPKDAYELLLQCVQDESKFVDAYYVLADINYQHGLKKFDDDEDKKASIAFYNTAKIFYSNVIEICPSFNTYLAYYFRGEINFKFKEYASAKDDLLAFQKSNKTDLPRLEATKKMLDNVEEYFRLINNPVPFEPVLLEGVNTDEDEYLPLISPDGDFIFYTHRFKKNAGTSNELFVEEFAFSKRISPVDSLFEIYQAGKSMPNPFNDGRNQGGASITIDNRHLYITICEFERSNYTSYKNCDIFTSDNVEGKWTALRRMGSNINSSATFEGQPSITSDGKELYFSSAREGGYGGMDIYRSIKDAKGEWGKAQNLGSAINTAGNDKTPFIHSDSHTLYYSSDGKFGIGGHDIFYSQYLGNSKWSEPKNIGYPINTVNDEVGFIVSTNGKKIYFSSNTLNGKGGWDIYSSILYEAARPEEVLFVKGKILDEKGGIITDAKVELTSVQTKKTTEGFVDDATGNFAVAVTVQPHEEFIMTTKKDGYFYSSQYINSEDNKFQPPTTMNVEVSKIKTDTPIKLNNVNFATNSTVLNELSRAILDDLIQFMKKNPNLNIEVLGHTDNVGTTVKNLDLSNRRASAVATYLSSKGIDNKRITHKGYGKTRPVKPNTTEEGRAYNRRVEFMVKMK